MRTFHNLNAVSLALVTNGIAGHFGSVAPTWESVMRVKFGAAGGGEYTAIKLGPGESISLLIPSARAIILPPGKKYQYAIQTGNGDSGSKMTAGVYPTAGVLDMDDKHNTIPAIQNDSQAGIFHAGVVQNHPWNIADVAGEFYVIANATDKGQMYMLGGIASFDAAK